MKTVGISFTNHSKKRMNQRGITNNQIEFTMSYGLELIQEGGYFVYYLSRKVLDNPHLRSYKRNFLDWIGTAVVTGFDGHIITTFKNKNIKNITKRFLK